MTAPILAVVAAILAVLLIVEFARQRRAVEARELYRKIFNDLHIGINVWHLEDPSDPGSLRLIASNPAAAAATGIPSVKWIGRTILDVFPEAVPRGIAADLAEVARVGRLKDLGELSYGDARIQEGIYSVFAYPLPGRCTAVAFENITKQKLAAMEVARKATYVQLLQEVACRANEADSISAALEETLPQICEHTGWVVGHAYLRDGNGPSLVHTRHWHLANPQLYDELRAATDATRFTAGVGLPGRVLNSGAAEWVVDLSSATNVPQAKVAVACELRSAYAFPILLDGNVTGVLEFFATDTWVPDELLLETMQRVGRQLGRVIERQRGSPSVGSSAAPGS